MRTKNTSWDKSAKWYEKMLEAEGTYQKDLILPNLLRLMEIKKGESVLDLACGTGFFSREFHKTGARVMAADISKNLIEIALKNSPASIEYHIAPAHELKFLKNGAVDKIAAVLAIQNIENIQAVFSECARVLKNHGKMFLVLNHPCFRVPKFSSWGWDENAELKPGKRGIQYRRIDHYLSEARVKIQMHPGEAPDEFTLSFHRPLQVLSKALNKAGFLISKMEEWNSNRKSEPGPRAEAENLARKEIPLFLMVEAMKIDY